MHITKWFYKLECIISREQWAREISFVMALEKYDFPTESVFLKYFDIALRPTLPTSFGI